MRDKITIILVLSIIILSIALFIETKNTETSENIIKQKKKEIVSLVDELTIKQKEIEKLQLKNDSLYDEFKNRNKEFIVKEVKRKNNETYYYIINASDSLQLDIFSKWIGENNER